MKFEIYGPFEIPREAGTIAKDLGAFGTLLKKNASVRQMETFAVGTAIADRPPHRSVLAEFPHTAPISGS